jgi:carbon monoxide dehydrogenase subunit G
VLGPETYRFVVRVGHGVIRGKFHGEVRLTEVAEPRNCRFEFFAKGFAGSVSGFSSVFLRPNDDSTETEVAFDGEARVRGLLRTLSRHVFEQAIDSLADHVFQELARS